MAEKVYRTQVTLMGKSGLPEDRYMNTLHAAINDTTELASITAWHSALLDFWLDGANGVDAGWAFLSNVVRQNDHTITTYDLSDPTPRVPVVTDTWDLPGALSVEGYPSQVAICVSYGSALGSGQNRARFRNRFYFGPLKNTSGDLDVSSIRPTAALLSCLSANAQALAQASDDNTDGWSWIAHSDLTPLALTGRAVTYGWIDNRFDTQRRRLEPASNRTLWEIE